jgi:hypothetical protein
MALHARGRSFWVQRSDERPQKRVEFEIAYDLCVICLGAIAKGIKKTSRIKTDGREK